VVRREGWAFAGLRSGWLLYALVAVSAALSAINAPVRLPIALFPVINAERYGGDPRTLGLFTSAIGVGGLISAAGCHATRA